MTTNTNPQSFHCDECGTLVGWATTRDGVRYLANLSREYQNGARYRRGAHHKTCADSKAAREERRAAEAKWQAGQTAVRIMHRWTAVYGDDFRAWVQVDQEAARAHYDALTSRLGF